MPNPTTPHAPKIIMYPSRKRKHVRRVSVESIDVILANLESRAPNYPPISFPPPLDEHFVYAQRSLEHWFVHPPEPSPLSRVRGPLSFFWASFVEGWTEHIPASWDDIDLSQMTHDEQTTYYRKKMDDLREADKREEERYTRNARYLVERKRRGLPIIPDPRIPPPSFPPRVTPYLYGKDIETRLHRRARALRQMVWNVDHRSISEVVYEEEKFVGRAYRRSIGKRWTWRKSNPDATGSRVPGAGKAFPTRRKVVRRPVDGVADLFDDDEEWEMDVEVAMEVAVEDALASHIMASEGELAEVEHTGSSRDEEAEAAQESAIPVEPIVQEKDESPNKEPDMPVGVPMRTCDPEAVSDDEGAAVEGERGVASSEGGFEAGDFETESDEAVQLGHDASGGQDGNSARKGASLPSAPMGPTHMRRRARHSRNKHSLVDLQLELDEQAVSIADELDILATIAFPTVPRRNSTGEMPEEVRVEIVPPTPIATNDLWMDVCQRAEALWNPDEDVFRDEAKDFEAWEARRVQQCQGEGHSLLAVPSPMRAARSGNPDDKEGEAIYLGSWADDEDDLWPGWAEAVEESKVMNWARREREGWVGESSSASGLEDGPKLGESLVGSALAWWQAGAAGPDSSAGGGGHGARGAQSHDPCAIGASNQPQEARIKTLSAGEDVERQGGQGDPQGQEASQVKADYKGKGKAKE